MLIIHNIAFLEFNKFILERNWFYKFKFILNGIAYRLLLTGYQAKAVVGKS